MLFKARKKLNRIVPRLELFFCLRVSFDIYILSPIQSEMQVLAFAAGLGCESVTEHADLLSVAYSRACSRKG